MDHLEEILSTEYYNSYSTARDLEQQLLWGGLCWWWFSEASITFLFCLLLQKRPSHGCLSICRRCVILTRLLASSLWFHMWSIESSFEPA
jgi:hypothetical protein